MVLRRRKRPSTLIASRANGHTVRVRWPPVGSAGRWRELEGCSCFGPHCLSRYVPVRSPKSRKRRRLSQQLAWWCAASSVVSQSARVVGGLLSRLCRLRPLCPPRKSLPPIAKTGGLLSNRGCSRLARRRLLVRCAHGSCRRTVVASSHTSFNSRHEVRGHHGCHRLLAAAWLTAATPPHFDTNAAVRLSRPSSFLRLSRQSLTPQ